VSTQKQALQVVTERLEKEKPVIVHDAHDSGDYILLLKGLSSATLDRDLSAPEAQDPIMKYLKSIEPVLPFLNHTGMLSSDWDMHSIRIGDREVTGFAIPSGKLAVDMMEQLYRDNDVPSPFTKLTTGADKGMIETIAELQGLDGKGVGGRA